MKIKSTEMNVTPNTNAMPIMGNKTPAEFIAEFVKYSKEHNDCLADQNYSKRSRLNKKLMGMLQSIDAFESPEEVISGIIESGDDYAVMWISNYAWKNGHCVEVIKAKLTEIKDRKAGPDSITAWALIAENTL